MCTFETLVREAFARAEKDHSTGGCQSLHKLLRTEGRPYDYIGAYLALYTHLEGHSVHEGFEDLIKEYYDTP